MMTIHTHARRGRALGLAVGSAAAALALSGLAPSGAEGANIALGGVDTVPNVNSRGRYVRISRIDDGTADYHPQIAEVHVEGVAPQRNVARGRPVIASGPTWTNFPASNITDGSAATITHPLSGEGGPFSFDVDLGQDYSLDRIQLYNRGDDCCPERLSNYT